MFSAILLVSDSICRLDGPIIFPLNPKLGIRGPTKHIDGIGLHPASDWFRGLEKRAADSDFFSTRCPQNPGKINPQPYPAKEIHP
jgi:hypothetical protein